MAATGALIIDQVTKAVARHALSVGEGRTVIPGFFTLHLVKNPGAAFGLFGALPILLVVVGLAAVLAIFALRKDRSKSRVLALALGLLVGGALGNLIDRVLYGLVTDFLEFGVTVAGRPITWPTFNVADIAIVVGVILLMYHTLFLEGQAAARPVETKAADKP